MRDYSEEITTLQQQTGLARWSELVCEADYELLEFWEWYVFWCFEEGLYNDLELRKAGR